MKALNHFHQFLLLIVLLGIMASCGGSGSSGQASQKAKQAINDRKFAGYLSSYTSGSISRKDNIVVQFARELDDQISLNPSIFRFSPDIEGHIQKLSNNSLAFVPESTLKSGQFYEARLAVNEIFPEAEGELQQFDFGFEVISQDIQLTLGDPKPINVDELKKQKLEGVITTADFLEEEEVEKMVKIVNGKAAKWTHKGNSHQFEVSDINRKESRSEVRIEVNGGSIGLDKVIKEKVEIPALNEFYLISTKPVFNPVYYISVIFSDPLDPKQDLSGLIEIENTGNTSVEVSGNEIKIYPGSKLTGNRNITIHQGIRNILGYKSNSEYRRTLSFQQEKPQLRLLGKGTILPSSKGMVMPFEAVNLKAVDVTIWRIFDSNVPQFLQVNRLSGKSQLKRVGRPVVKKTMSLENFGYTDLSVWNNFTLDLNALIQEEKGAIYQVELNFRRELAIYPCADQEEAEYKRLTLEDNWQSSDGSESSYWDDDYYYYYNPPGYRWNERDNPCHISYYNNNRKVTKNILSSNLGLISKISNDKKVLTITTDLLTAMPQGGAKVTLLDYQLQTIGEQLSDADGFTSFVPERKPFLAVAEYQGNKAYLKLDDGSSLSLSNFNVSGERINQGLKGFIYGERGVWRPGDPIYLTFILQDIDNRYPDDYPISLEFIDPRGDVRSKLTSTSPVGDMYAFALSTKPDDPTGNWRVNILVGNSSFSKSIKVETVKPNRLKVNIEFEKERITSPNTTLSADLDVKWLTGLTASSLKADFVIELVSIKPDFPRYAHYMFYDQTKDYYPIQDRIFKGKLDENGRVKINSPLDKPNVPGALKAKIKGKVYEPSGNFSVASASIPYYSYSSYTGVKLPEGDHRGMLLTDMDHNLDIVTLSPEGEPIDRKNLKVEVYKLGWRWWWDNADGATNYISTSYNQKVLTKKVNTVKGKATTKVQIKHPSWGRFYVKVSDPISGHSTGRIVYFDWPGWAGKGKKGLGATYLAVQTDKGSYEVGEDVKVSLPSGQKGMALVTIENGSKVIAKNWIETKEGKSDYAFKATDEMSPNVYVHVALFQPHAQTDNDLPIRLYGIENIAINDPETVLQPEMSLASEIRPLEEVSLIVEEKESKSMAYSIAVVDEGLLDLTNFMTPDPWNHFYRREALGVKTWDMFDDVIGAFGGKLERLLAVGGGMDEGARDKQAKANRFKPVAIYMGPFYLKPGQKANHSFKMPQYVGSVKTMVVAANAGAYGKTEQVSAVKKPLMVLGTLPRVVGPNEEITLPVTVMALEDDLGKVKVEVNVEGSLESGDVTNQIVELTKAGDQTVYFKLKALNKEGIAKVDIKASSGREEAIHHIELDCRNPNPAMTKVISHVLEKNQKFETDLDLFGVYGTNEAVVEVSSLPPLNIEKRLDYLIRYPHGCLEQTVSSVFPQLFISDVMEIDEGKKIKMEEYVKTAIDKLSRFVTAEGGFALWPGNSRVSFWADLYAGHFMIEARNRGYDIPNNLYNNWLKYAARSAKNWNKGADKYNDDYTQSYRLYLLALADKPERGYMNRLKEAGQRSVMSKWRLAEAYALTGRKDIAKAMMANLDFKSVNARSDYEYHYGSETRELAVMLSALAQVDEKEKAFEVFKLISKNLTDTRWMSTHTTAYALMSASKFLKGQGLGKDVKMELKYGNLKTREIESELPFFRESIPLNELKDNKVAFFNQGDGDLFLRVITKGKPVESGMVAASQNLRIGVSYQANNGTPVNVANVKQGEDITALVTVTHAGLQSRYNDLALTQIFPSGWEIRNDRLDDEFIAKEKYEYQDIRDDRVMTYFSLRKNESRTFKVKLNTTYAGKYYLPAVQVEEMYDNTVYGRTNGKWVVVR